MYLLTVIVRFYSARVYVNCKNWFLIQVGKAKECQQANHILSKNVHLYIYIYESVICTDLRIKLLSTREFICYKFCSNWLQEVSAPATRTSWQAGKDTWVDAYLRLSSKLCITMRHLRTNAQYILKEWSKWCCTISNVIGTFQFIVCGLKQGKPFVYLQSMCEFSWKSYSLNCQRVMNCSILSLLWNATNLYSLRLRIFLWKHLNSCSD